MGLEVYFVILNNLRKIRNSVNLFLNWQVMIIIQTPLKFEINKQLKYLVSNAVLLKFKHELRKHENSFLKSEKLSLL